MKWHAAVSQRNSQENPRKPWFVGYALNVTASGAYLLAVDIDKHEQWPSFSFLQGPETFLALYFGSRKTKYSLTSELSVYIEAVRVV